MREPFFLEKGGRLFSICRKACIGMEGRGKAMRRQERIGREESAQGERPAQIFLEGTGKRLAVRGHRGILEYTAEVLRLRLPGDEGEARIEGENLVLERMDGEDAVVTGRVHRVMLEEGQGERGVRGAPPPAPRRR